MNFLISQKIFVLLLKYFIKKYKMGKERHIIIWVLDHLFFKNLFYSSIVDLQCVNFCCTTSDSVIYIYSVTYMYIYIHSFSYSWGSLILSLNLKRKYTFSFLLKSHLEGVAENICKKVIHRKMTYRMI